MSSRVLSGKNWLKALDEGGERGHKDWALGALAEFVHNARDAQASEVKITTFPRPICPGESPEHCHFSGIDITDDGAGMASCDFSRIFQSGGDMPALESGNQHPHSIGGYGVGFNHGMISVAHTALVISCNKTQLCPTGHDDHGKEQGRICTRREICYGLLSNYEREEIGADLGKVEAKMLFAFEDFWTGESLRPSVTSDDHGKLTVVDVAEIEAFLRDVLRNVAAARTLRTRAALLKEKGGTTIILLGLRHERLKLELSSNRSCDIIDVQTAERERDETPHDSERPDERSRFRKSFRDLCSVMFYPGSRRNSEKAPINDLVIHLFGIEVQQNMWSLTELCPVKWEDKFSVEGKIGKHAESRDDNAFGFVIYCNGVLIEHHTYKLGYHNLKVERRLMSRRSGVVMVINAPKQIGVGSKHPDYCFGLLPNKSKKGIEWIHNGHDIDGPLANFQKKLIDVFESYCASVVDADSENVAVAKWFLEDVRKEICDVATSNFRKKKRESTQHPKRPLLWLPSDVVERLENLALSLNDVEEQERVANNILDLVSEIINRQTGQDSVFIQKAICDGYRTDCDDNDKHDLPDDINQEVVNEIRRNPNFYITDDEYYNFESILKHVYDVMVAKAFEQSTWLLNKEEEACEKISNLKELYEKGGGFKVGSKLLLPHEALVSAWKMFKDLENSLEDMLMDAKREYNKKSKTNLDRWLQCKHCQCWRKISDDDYREFKDEERQLRLEHKDETYQLDFSCWDKHSPLDSVLKEKRQQACQSPLHQFVDQWQKGSEVGSKQRQESIARDAKCEPSPSLHHQADVQIPIDQPHERYRLEKTISQNCTSSTRICEAVDTHSESRIIIKQFLPRRGTKTPTAEVQKAEERCRQEAKNIFRFQGVPKNLCRVLFWCGAGKQEGQNPSIAMPHYGDQLSLWWHKQTVKAKLVVAVQIASAVCELHRQCVHDDIKPDNILVKDRSMTGGDIEATLIDFETVKDDRLKNVCKTDIHDPIKNRMTLKYAAPEVLSGLPGDGIQRLSQRDIWSVGITLSELFAEKEWDSALLNGTSDVKIIQEICSNRGQTIREMFVKKLPEEVPNDIKDAILACLHCEYDRRISAVKLRDNLRSCLKKLTQDLEFVVRHGSPFVYNVSCVDDVSDLRDKGKKQIYPGEPIALHEYVRTNCKSHYISCTRSFKWALHHYLLRKIEGKSNLKIIQVDMSKISSDTWTLAHNAADLSCRYIDLSYAEARALDGWHKQTQNYATCAKEVVFEHWIPPAAIKRVLDPTCEKSTGKPKTKFVEDFKWRRPLNLDLLERRRLNGTEKNYTSAESTYKLMDALFGVCDADEFATNVLREMEKSFDKSIDQKQQSSKKVLSVRSLTERGNRGPSQKSAGTKHARQTPPKKPSKPSKKVAFKRVFHKLSKEEREARGWVDDENKQWENMTAIQREDVAREDEKYFKDETAYKEWERESKRANKAENADGESHACATQRNLEPSTKNKLKQNVASPACSAGDNATSHSEKWRRSEKVLAPSDAADPAVQIVKQKGKAEMDKLSAKPASAKAFAAEVTSVPAVAQRNAAPVEMRVPKFKRQASAQPEDFSTNAKRRAVASSKTTAPTAARAIPPTIMATTAVSAAGCGAASTKRNRAKVKKSAHAATTQVVEDRSGLEARSTGSVKAHVNKYSSASIRQPASLDNMKRGHDMIDGSKRKASQMCEQTVQRNPKRRMVDAVDATMEHEKTIKIFRFLHKHVKEAQDLEALLKNLRLLADLLKSITSELFNGKDESILLIEHVNTIKELKKHDDETVQQLSCMMLGKYAMLLETQWPKEMN